MVIPVSKTGRASWVETPEKVEVPDTLSVPPRMVGPTASNVAELESVVAEMDPAAVMPPFCKVNAVPAMVVAVMAVPDNVVAPAIAPALVIPAL